MKKCEKQTSDAFEWIESDEERIDEVFGAKDANELKSFFKSVYLRKSGLDLEKIDFEEIFECQADVRNQYLADQSE